MDSAMNQAAALAIMCQEQSAFLAESAANPVSTPQVLTEKEMELDEYDPKTKTQVFKSESMEVISKILEVVGVDSWEKLPGKYIRFEDNGWGSTVTKIGNIIDDKWIDFKEFFSVKGE